LHQPDISHNSQPKFAVKLTSKKRRKFSMLWEKKRSWISWMTMKQKMLLSLWNWPILFKPIKTYVSFISSSRPLGYIAICQYSNYKVITLSGDSSGW